MIEHTTTQMQLLFTFIDNQNEILLKKSALQSRKITVPFVSQVSQLEDAGALSCKATVALGEMRTFRLQTVS